MTDDELRKLAEAAMPGPWQFSPDWVNEDNVVDSQGESLAGADYGGSVSFRKADGAFIAAANPSKILRLLERIEKLRAELSIHAGETWGCEMNHKAREKLAQDDEAQKESDNG